MRITFVLPDLSLAGGTRVLAEYATRLRARGHEVLVVSIPRPATPLRRRIKSLVLGRGWPRHRNGPSHFDGRNVALRALERHRSVMDGDVPDADVVVATWWETAEGVAALAARKGAKAYFLQGFEAWDGQPAGRVEAAWKLPLHKITIARWLVNLARDRYGDHDVDLVPNAVDTEQFHAPPRGKQPSPTVGLMYSTTRFKGCDISLDAVRRAGRNVAGLRLVAFGIDQPSPELPLPDGAAFFHQPSQTMLKDVYSRCDAWLFGSRTEGFGLPLLEAMACRTPVVATPAGAAPELLAEGGGVLVEPENPQDMADAIVRVCGLSAEAWRAMSDAAYSTATGYTWDDATDLFEAALRRAITRAGRGEIAGCGWGSDK